MRLFIIRFASFMLLVAGCAALVRALTTHALARDEKSLQDLAWAQEAATAEVLVLGDSHARESIDGRLLPRSFIYAASGEHLPFTEAKLRLALAAQPTPRLRHLVLAVGLQAFTGAAALPMSDEWYYAAHADAWALTAVRGTTASSCASG